MSVQAVGSTDATYLLDALDATRQKRTSETNGPSPFPADGPPELSQMGQMLAKLESLASSDPQKFKDVTQEISDKLKTAAASATGKEADWLNDMSKKFADASTSGTTDAIRPPRHHGGGHRHHKYEEQDTAASALDPSASAASTTTSTTTATTSSASSTDAIKALWDGIFALVNAS